jgi:hypothetical protein
MLGGDQLLEEEADRFLDRQGLPPFGREDDPVLGLDAIDALLHESTSARAIRSAQNSHHLIGRGAAELAIGSLAIERAYLEPIELHACAPLTARGECRNTEPKRIPEGLALAIVLLQIAFEALDGAPIPQ